MTTLVPLSKEEVQQLIDMSEPLIDRRPMRADVKASLDNWAERAWMPGDFLRAVLENDLMQAINRADAYNLGTIAQITRYIYTNLPGGCHGSPDRVRVWSMNFKEPKK